MSRRIRIISIGCTMDVEVIGGDSKEERDAFIQKVVDECQDVIGAYLKANYCDPDDKVVAARTNNGEYQIRELATGPVPGH